MVIFTLCATCIELGKSSATLSAFSEITDVFEVVNLTWLPHYTALTPFEESAKAYLCESTS